MKLIDNIEIGAVIDGKKVNYEPTSPVFWGWDSVEEAISVLPADVATRRLNDVVTQQGAVRRIIFANGDPNSLSAEQRSALEKQASEAAKQRLQGVVSRRTSSSRLTLLKNNTFAALDEGRLKGEAAAKALRALKEAEAGNFSLATELGLLTP